MKPIEVGLSPKHSKENPFINLFAECFSAPRYKTHEFLEPNLTFKKYKDDAYNLSLSFKMYDLVILHWPDRYFRPAGMKGAVRKCMDFLVMYLSKRTKRTRYLWVVHNIKPHDVSRVDALTARWFFYFLDGVIFLSKSSREIAVQAYPALGRKPSLVTRHGHYLPAMQSPPRARAVSAGKTTSFLFFGQVRPYKNVEKLVQVFAEIPEMKLAVAGRAISADLALKIKGAAEGHDNILVLLRKEIVEDKELEALIDAADAVILPYADILNSGSVLLALSRNRPVLAPRSGSLPEIQKEVGPEWLSLYDGDIRPETVRDFHRAISRDSGGQAPDLSLYDWDGIGLEVRNFADALLAPDKRPQAEP